VLTWPIVAIAGFLVLTGIVVSLGMSATARYEFERNRVPQQAPQPAPRGSAAHPAGRARTAQQAGAQPVDAPRATLRGNVAADEERATGAVGLRDLEARDRDQPAVEGRRPLRLERRDLARRLEQGLLQQVLRSEPGGELSPHVQPDEGQQPTLMARAEAVQRRAIARACGFDETRCF